MFSVSHYSLINNLTMSKFLMPFKVLNPFTATSDQDRISPYNINTISSRQVMRIEKNINYGIIVDPIPNSLNQHHKNCMADSKENY